PGSNHSDHFRCRRHARRNPQDHLSRPNHRPRSCIMNTLTLDDVCLSFADGDEQVHALDHVTLTVSAGELVAVSGASGSGKSSLLAVAGALRTPDTGRVVIGDTEITAASPRE